MTMFRPGGSTTSSVSAARTPSPGKRTRRTRWSSAGGAAVAGLVLVGSVAACGRSSGAGSSGAIVLGASLSLTGSLQSFGTSLQLGYQQVVNEVNAAGGLDVGGTKRHVKLVIEDNASDGNKAAGQARDLVLQRGAVALLGSATPPVNIPVSVAAEQLKVPLIVAITPVQAWEGAATSRWKYAWDMFFSEDQMTRTQLQVADLVRTDKKIALFTDQEEDGIVMGGLWEKAAPAMGYTIAYHAQFPVGNTNFSSQVTAAKASGADIVIAQVIPPDGISLLREMKAQGWDPKLVFIEKGGDTGNYPQLSAGLADGVLAANWFARGLGLPQESEFISKYAGKVGGVNSDLGTVVYGYSAAKILLDAISAAKTTDAPGVNAAIGATSADFPAGHVHFNDKHAAILPAVQTQWDGSSMQLVMTSDGKAASKITVPNPGLR